VGQSVKVSYTKDADVNRQLQDLSDNKAAAFTNKDVTNTSDTTLPKPVSGVLNGSTLTLTFNKSMAAVTSNAIYQFAVKLNGYSQSVSSISVSGTTLTLTLPSSGTSSQTASVTYTPGSYPLRDLSGNAVTGFNDFYVANTNDTVPPALTGATASGTKITLIYNEGLSTASIPLKSNFSVIKDGASATISSVAINNNTVELTLAQAIETNKTVYVSYIPTSQGIKDLAGNLAPAINSYQVTGTVAATATLVSATINQNEITLSYSAGLSTASIPYASQYYAKVNGSFSSISSVNVYGSQVRLILAVPVTYASAVTFKLHGNGEPAEGSVESASRLLHGHPRSKPGFNWRRRGKRGDSDCESSRLSRRGRNGRRSIRSFQNLDDFVGSYADRQNDDSLYVGRIKALGGVRCN